MGADGKVLMKDDWPRPIFIVTVFSDDEEEAIKELRDIAERFGLEVQGEARFFDPD